MWFGKERYRKNIRGEREVDGLGEEVRTDNLKLNLGFRKFKCD
jgi:hypothetical protein